MDLMQYVPDAIADNWALITTIGTTVAGAYIVKVKRAVSKFQIMIKEGEDVQRVIVKALKPDEAGVTIIDEEECKQVAKEISEFIPAMHESADAIMAILPKSLSAKIPFKTR